MQDLSEKLSQVLSDPESMEKIKALAGMLASNGAPKEEEPAPSPPAPKEPQGKDDLVSKLLPMLASYGGGADDPKVRLLIALKPYLRDERKKSVDDAVSIMKLLSACGKAINLF